MMAGRPSPRATSSGRGEIDPEFGFDGAGEKALPLTRVDQRQRRHRKAREPMAKHEEAPGRGTDVDRP